jgi:DNA mismatch repair protein MutL
VQPLFPAHGVHAPAGAPAAPALAARENPFRLLDPRSVLQVFDLYLVLQGDQGLVVVDQHALHERVLYERLKKQHERSAQGGSVKVQRLLSPEVIDVQPVDKAYLLEVKAALAEEGFLIDDFGGNAVAIHGLPAVLGKSSPGRVLAAFLRSEGIDEARPRARAAVAERFHSMACRGAVMSGDRLGQDEIQRLLSDARDLEHPHNCPHGRPTVLTFTRAELERFFRRRP